MRIYEIATSHLCEAGFKQLPVTTVECQMTVALSKKKPCYWRTMQGQESLQSPQMKCMPSVFVHIMWPVKYTAVVITSSSGVSLKVLPLFVIFLCDRIRFYVQSKCKFLKIRHCRLSRNWATREVLPVLRQAWHVDGHGLPSRPAFLKKKNSHVGCEQ